MPIVTFDKLAVAYDNVVTPASVSSIVTTGITGFVSGFPAANLEYEDPWTIAKTNGISATVPTIELQFASAQTPTVCGILNHNLGSGAYIRVEVQYENPALTWNPVAGADPVGDKDLFIPWDSVGAHQNWRIAIDHFSGTGPDFYIGTLFFGSFREMINSPITGGMIQTRRTPIVKEQSSGGASHVTFGGNKRDGNLELTWRRAHRLDLDFMQNRFLYQLLGILTPELGYSQVSEVYYGGEPFWGYISDRNFTPSMGAQDTSLDSKYDFTIFLEGAI